MRFEPLDIDGAWLLRPQTSRDARGSFARAYCRNEYAQHGLDSDVVQASISRNAMRGTLRGLHFQWPPSREAKTVRCIRGAMWDVLLDLRPLSPSYLRHQAVQLESEEGLAVYIPHGVAHGFQTLADDTEVLYLMSDFFAPELSAGVRWNDPAFGIDWPLTAVNMSERDATYPDFQAAAFEARLRK